MARITPIPPEEWPAELGVNHPEKMGQVERDVLGIQAYMPETARALRKLAAARAGEGTLSRRLHELIRLRVAFFNQCRSCMAVRYSDDVGEDLICSLERPREADDLTDAEKSALRFAELLATNHLAIDDAVYADLRLYFTESQLVELGTSAAMAVGMGRLAATWQVTDHLSDHYLQEGTVTPWQTVSA